MNPVPGRALTPSVSHLKPVPLGGGTSFSSNAGSLYGFSEEINGVDLIHSLRALKRTQSAILLLLERGSSRLKDGRFIAIDFYNAVEKILGQLPSGSSFYQNQIDILPNDLSKRAIVDLTMQLLSNNFPLDDSGFPETVPFSESDITKVLKISIQDGELFNPGRVTIPNEGSLNLSNNKKIARDIKNTLQTIISTWMLHLINLHRANEIKRLDFLANYDPLTEIGNRRSLFSEILLGDESYYLMIDLDHFKNINDTFGHPIGDIVLQRVSSVLHEVCLENGAKIYRFGGEEFTVTGSGNRDKAQIVAQLILENIRGMRINVNGLDQEITLTVSIGGITNNILIDGERGLDTLIKSADIALYVSKQNGRDQVNFFNEIPEPESISHTNIRQRDV